MWAGLFRRSPAADREAASRQQPAAEGGPGHLCVRPCHPHSPQNPTKPPK